jgi:C4-dicarboxylate transporter DctM subunit
VKNKTTAIVTKGLKGLAWLEDNISAVFLGSSILLLFYEVLARYFFNTAVYVSTEWTPVLVTWSMLMGNSILIRERGHINISLFEDSLKKPENKSWLKLYISAINLIFCLIFLNSSIRFVSGAKASMVLSESLLHTPMWIIFSMMVIAGVLMLINSFVKVCEDAKEVGTNPKSFKTAMPLILLAITGVILAFVMLNGSPLVIMAVMMCGFMLLGVPITFALGMATIVAIMRFDIIATASLASKMFYSINKYSLLAIPFFVVSGNIMAKSSIGKYLLEWASALLRSIQGGLAMAIVGAAIIFAAVSGASAAAAAALGVMGLPLLVEKGYPKSFGAGLIAAGGTLAIIIPPSSIMILYACTAEVSTTDMFKAGIVPGIIIAIVLVAYIYGYCKKNGFGKDDVGKFSINEVLHTSKKAIWALLMPIAILGAIYSGICTATEAAAVSVIYAGIVCLFIYKDVKIGEFKTIFYDSVRTSAFILAITMTATLFGFLITMEKLPQMILNIVLGANINRVGLLIALNCVMFLLGFFMSPGAIILIVVPMILPVTEAMGINPIHLGIMLTVNLELALLTPPVGTNLYVLSKISKLPVPEVIKGLIPFIVILFLALMFLTFVPSLSLCLL